MIKNTNNAGHLIRLIMPELTDQPRNDLYDALNDPEYGASPNLDKTVIHYTLEQKGTEDDEASGMDVSRGLYLANTLYCM